MTKLKVEFQNLCVYSERDPEEYGSWSEDYDNSVVSVSLSDRPNVICPESLKKGDIAFLVWLEVSEGDSFGNATAKRVEAVAVLSEKHLAEYLQTKIELHDKQTSEFDAQKNKVEAQIGSFKIPFYAFWAGDMFSNIHSINVEEIIIQ